MDFSPEYVNNYFDVYDGELFDNDVDYIDDYAESDDAGYNTESKSVTNLTGQTEPSPTSLTTTSLTTTSPTTISPTTISPTTISPTTISTASSNSITATSITSKPACENNVKTTTTTKYYTYVAKCHSFDQGGLFEYELVPRETLSMVEYMENCLGAFENLLKCMANVQSQLEDANNKLAIIREERNIPWSSIFQNCITEDNSVTKNNNLAIIKE